MLIFLCGFVKLPMNIKMLFSFMSDSIPVFGSKRKGYLVIGSFILFFSLLMLGIQDKQDIYVTTFYLVMSSLGITMCNVVGEALIIESGKQQTNDQITQSISVFSAFRKLAFSAMVYLSAVLLMTIPKRKIFLYSAIIPAIVLLSSLFVQERDVLSFPSVRNQLSRLITFTEMREIRRPAIFLFLTTVSILCD
ncbi:conserved hypothetical protein [Theileria equi strain WA]|uniref:Uncharacterized protein n=1 Tax=Theileria equi strain WA TaxID=1537102 RepID=L1LEY0_THEEQ|nr:conserved hypothetical protein [Theileria equi strain WA]EKX73834.1 conserved hypothetical protein [Theileria equi strain WA]|eukprot:XP_004833286.1 conserved hypothetical protein [Theileria equi strain WA]